MTKELSIRIPPYLEERRVPPQRFHFAPRNLHYQTTYVEPGFALEQDVLDVFNSGSIRGYTVLVPEMARIDISRQITIIHPKSPQRRVALGGIGVVRFDEDDTLNISTPDLTMTIEQWAEKMNLKESMRTQYILPDGSIRIEINKSRLGVYEPEHAQEKLERTQLAKTMLNGVAAVPEVMLVCTDEQQGVSGFVTAIPRSIYPSEFMFHMARQKRGYTLETLLWVCASVAHAGFHLHQHGYVHNQLGKNWMISADRSTPPVLIKDWETLQSIQQHDTKPLERFNGRRIVNRRLSAQQMARMVEVGDLVTTSQTLLRAMYMDHVSQCVAAAMVAGYSPTLGPPSKVVQAILTDAENFPSSTDEQYNFAQNRFYKKITDSTV